MRIGTRLLSSVGLFAATRPALNHPDENAGIVQLRQRLRTLQTTGAPRMASIDTESRLVIELSRSPRPEERQEALEVAEGLWRELNDRTVPIMTPTRTAMRVNLCSALRRCALLSRDREAADLWTARFAERATRLSPTDFIQTEEHQAAWRGPAAAAAAKVRPGTGITQEDMDADALEEAAASGAASGEGEGGGAPRKKKTSPMQDYRHEVFLDHPSFEYAFRKGRAPSPGPRYTG